MKSGFAAAEATASRYSPSRESPRGGGLRTPSRRPAMYANSKRATRMPCATIAEVIAFIPALSMAAPAPWASRSVTSNSGGASHNSCVILRS